MNKYEIIKDNNIMKETQYKTPLKQRLRNRVGCRKWRESQRGKDYAKQYYQEHREVLLQKAKQWQKDNPERVKQYRTEHKDVINQRTAKWQRDNREWCNEYHRLYYAKHYARERQKESELL